MDSGQDQLDRAAVEQLTAAGLFDPVSPSSAEREELLRYLLERFSVEEIVSWAQRTDLVGVAARAIDRPPPFISAVEAAERAGVAVELVEELRQALGFPVLDASDPSIPETVVDDIGTYVLGIELYGRDEVLAFARVLGWAAARVGEAARAMFGLGVQRIDPGRRTELEVAKANEAGILAWMQVQSIMVHLLAEHPIQNVGFALALTDPDLQMGVAFVDLVGSTRWADEAEPDRHRAGLRRFEMQASAVASSYGARLVKLIGDEAMVVAEDPDRLCRVAIGICDMASHDQDLPDARGAVGFGAVTVRDGDYFGPLVNAVARATKLAEPGGVVATADVARALDPMHWTTEPIGPHKLRGVTDLVHLERVFVRSPPRVAQHRPELRPR